ncbi:DUF6062 family protein [Dictyobacter aurantiacus]|uniref:Uncharacterized protein n=1 Tax=Dictyobacter aurantiacus TaxID=1936993 RepID=A0A401ZAU4_9CHLR|nr:DUF6062 family protein [Dictyobacter aurantiacus]GCE03987.1 hypothetical protein KDAU_13160 [Dictyobacter aurantiacus]
MVKTREYQALLSACAREGCLLCNLVHESIYRYLDSWKYELFTDVEIRQELRNTQGFCYIHTWQLARMGATLPIAQAYRDILSDTIDQLQQNSSATGPSGGLFRRLFENKEDATNKPDCPACKQKAQAEERYIHSLRQALLDDEFLAALSQSTGLCLDHFKLASEMRTKEVPGNWYQRLRQAQLTCLQRLDAQLGELIRKHDYRFKEEERGSEMLAWKRAAGLVAGEDVLS